MRRFFPFLNWLPSYNKRLLVQDAMAGLTVGIVLIPQGMAYAMIAGLPPVYGLYASLMPLLVYAFLGTSRQLAIGPVAMDALLVAAGLGALVVSGIGEYIALAILLTFMVGAIQLILGFFRMGFLINFLSKPVISGFTSAAAIIITFSQLRHLLGTDIVQSSRFHILFNESFREMHNTHGLTLLIGIGGIILILLLKQWNRKIPSFLIVVLMGILLVSILGLERYGVDVVGNIPKGLPAFRVPAISWEHVNMLMPMAVALAVISYTEAISIGQSLDEKNGEDIVDPNQELLAIGASNLIGSFFQSYSVTGSFSRSAINNKLQARTPMAGLIGMLLVALTLLFFTPLFHDLPKAVLASIIMVSVAGLVEIRYPAFLWVYQREEFFVLIFTFLFTLFLGIQQGILLGVLLSLMVMLYRTSKPHFAILGKIKNTEYYRNVERFRDDVEVREDLLIVRFDSQLYFGNRNYFKKQLNRYIEAKGRALRCIILNAEAINYIDSSATSMLVKLIHEIQMRNIKFYISGAIGPARDVIFNSAIIELLPKEHLFVRIHEAVDYFDKPGSASEVQERIAYQSKPYGND
jgi:SulP family sulfate permease